ncbi:MAG: nucleotidyltransferase domain-containing protein [Gammaproteobacteria bacterium]
MRLSDEEKAAIKGVVRQVFGEDAIVRVFGSRVDDRRRGGDIDLHLEVPKDKSSLAYELRFQLELLKALGERKVDVVLYAQGAAAKPIDAIALRTGIQL